ncbi:MAG TPA: hypothetical protein VM347_13610, partial [Nonomuraea sp.]|nr:hypothetical protein [Nonomuraea sp.]
PTAASSRLPPSGRDASGPPDHATGQLDARNGARPRAGSAGVFPEDLNHVRRFTQKGQPAGDLPEGYVRLP